MVTNHPVAFALMPDSQSLVRWYWSMIRAFGEKYFRPANEVSLQIASSQVGTDGDAIIKSIDEKITLKGFLIIRACIKLLHNPTQTFKYNSPEDKEERINAQDQISILLTQHGFVREMMSTIIARFFVFRSTDLQEWLEEPEEWEKREEGDGEDWEFSLRSCSEKLFLDLVTNYKLELTGELGRLFYRSIAPDCNILLKDSIYAAIGLAASVVHPVLDFDRFIRETLVFEVQSQMPGYNIIRRRAAILLAQWSSVKIARGSRPLVYQIFRYLLNPAENLNDQVVRITAGRQFYTIANDWNFEAGQFLPFAEGIVTQLGQLIEEVELMDTKMALLNTISIIVERLEQLITPYAEKIVELLPTLWTQSGEEHLMKQAILTILVRLINSMQAKSLPLHAMLLPIIKGAVEPGSEIQEYLLEDALDLLGALLAQTPTGSASSQLMALVKYLYPIYESGSENLRKALEITDSFLILNPQQMLEEEFRVPLMTALTGIVGNLRSEPHGYLCSVAKNLIRSAHNKGGEEAISQLTVEMTNCGFIGKLLGGLYGSWTAHCTTGPRARELLVDGAVETDCFSIVARLILGSTTAFCQACQVASNESLESTMKWLLEDWFSHLENISDPTERKLMCLALTQLLHTQQPFILVNLQSLMSMWTSVVMEIRKEDEGGSVTARMEDQLVFTAEQAALMTVSQYSDDSHGAKSPEDLRQAELTVSDPVRTIHVQQWIAHHLDEAVIASGGEQAFQEQWLINVDRDVLDSFVELKIFPSS